MLFKLVIVTTEFFIDLNGWPIRFSSENSHSSYI